LGGFSVGQAYNDTIGATVTNWLSVEADADGAASAAHRISLALFQAPVVVLVGDVGASRTITNTPSAAPPPTAQSEWSSKFRPEFSGLRVGLPKNVQLASFAAFDVEAAGYSSTTGTGSASADGSASDGPIIGLLVRLQHIFAVGEHPTYVLSSLFVPCGLSAVHTR
jgi:hypothetical protein